MIGRINWNVVTHAWRISIVDTLKNQRRDYNYPYPWDVSALSMAGIIRFIISTSCSLIVLYFRGSHSDAIQLLFHPRGINRFCSGISVKSYDRDVRPTFPLFNFPSICSINGNRTHICEDAFAVRRVFTFP